MNISVILGHPHKGSFNHAIAKAAVQALAQNGHAVWYHDLYKERFDPLLPYNEIPQDAVLDAVIQRHCDEIAQADGIVIVHPNWWGQPPAILKGWIDRAIRPGVAYEFEEGDGGEGVPAGLLKAQTALVFNTANTPEKRELEVFGDPLQALWKNCILNLCGVRTFYRKMYRVIVISTLEQRRAWLDDVQDTVMAFFPAELDSGDVSDLSPQEVTRIARFLDVDTPEPEQADLAFVFGTRHPDPAFIAADLFKRGVVRYIALTGSANRDDGVNEARAHLRILLGHGVLGDSIVVEDRSSNTQENVRLALSRVGAQIGLDNVRSILAIAKWYHSRRALMTLKRHCPPGVRFFVKTYEPGGLAASDWHKNPQAARRAIREWHSVSRYLAKGDIVPIHRENDFFI